MKRSCFWHILFAAMLLLSKNVFGQYTNSYQLPKIIPPSPEAQNFMRYGEIPVDYSTGVPNISVPIWQLKSGKLELPITISYHAAGIKVNDRSSVVGLGWVLNGGGIVSRTILGYPDEAWPKPTYKTAYANDSARTAFFATNPTLTNRRAYGGSMATEKDYTDWESDRFFYQLPTGESGTFRYDFMNGNLVKVPYSPVKIEKIITTNVNPYLNVLSAFKITSSNGTICYFDVLEDGSAGSTSWVISKMISADKTDTIRFVYGSQANEHINPTYSSSVDYGDQPSLVGGASFIYTTNYYYNTQVNSEPYYSRSKVLDSIITSTTVIKCTNVGDREDMDQGLGKYRLSKLSIYDRLSGNLIREIAFNQSYFGSSGAYNQRMRLDSLSFNSSNSIAVETYRFKYEDEIPIPYAYMSSYHSYGGGIFGEDFWGYYNGTASQSLLPSEFVPDTIPGTSFAQLSYWMRTSRSPNHVYAKKALIKEIGYPTGGKTVFDFEPNVPHLDNNDLGDVGGFRIKKITNYTDSLIVANSKTYEYGYGTTRLPQASLFLYNVRNYYFEGYLDPIEGISSTCATETMRTVAFSSSLLPLTADNGPTVFYSGINEYEGDTSGINGKTTYSYIQPPLIPTIVDNERFHSPYELDRGNYTPKLFAKEIYKKHAGQYVPVKKELNTYSPFLSNEFNTGMRVVLNSEYPTSSQTGDYTGGTSCTVATSTAEYPYYFIFTDTKAIEEESLLTKKEIYEYSPSGLPTMVDSVLYTYGNLTHLQPTEQKSISSKGDTLKTKFKYPIDYAGTAAYDSLLSRNVVVPVIEQSSYKNSTFLQSAKTIYSNWSSTLTAPETVESKMLTNSTETRVRFHAYDTKGNVLSVSKENGMKLCYLWDYNNAYPVAEVSNADTGTIAYTSFESENKGKWSYSGVQGPDFTPPTGYQIYILNGSNDITKSGLSSGSTYVVSYWTKNSSAFTITGTISGYPVAGRSLNGWKYFEHRITGQTQVTLTGTGGIDELRLYPLGAQMTSYTYDPLIGVKTQCDPNNRIVYYNYDNFNRLVLVRDQDMNIIKKICYNYTGQSESCVQFFTNVDQSQSFIRSNCSSGYIGSSVDYTVAGGLYTSTVSTEAANKIARSHVDTYGQNYADTVGSCTLMIGIDYTNYAPTSCYIVEFSDPVTNFDAFFEVTSSSGTLGYVPPGTYDVNIYSAYSCDLGNYRTYNACGSYTSNTVNTAFFTGVTINGSCHSVGIQ